MPDLLELPSYTDPNAISPPPEPQKKPDDSKMTLREYIDTAGDRIGVPKQLRDAIYGEESNFSHYEAPGVVKKGRYKDGRLSGALGVSQLMPATAARHGVDINDPIQNAYGGLKEQKRLYDKYLSAGNSPNEAALLAAAAYNAGEGAVEKYHGIPPYAETQGYVSRIGKKLKKNPIQSNGKPGAVTAPVATEATSQTNTQPAPSSPVTREVPAGGYLHHAQPSTAITPDTQPSQPDSSFYGLDKPGVTEGVRTVAEKDAQSKASVDRAFGPGIWEQTVDLKPKDRAKLIDNAQHMNTISDVTRLGEELSQEQDAARRAAIRRAQMRAKVQASKANQQRNSIIEAGRAEMIAEASNQFTEVMKHTDPINAPQTQQAAMAGLTSAITAKPADVVKYMRDRGMRGGFDFNRDTRPTVGPFGFHEPVISREAQRQSIVDTESNRTVMPGDTDAQTRINAQLKAKGLPPLTPEPTSPDDRAQIGARAKQIANSQQDALRRNQPDGLRRVFRDLTALSPAIAITSHILGTGSIADEPTVRTALGQTGPQVLGGLSDTVADLLHFVDTGGGMVKGNSYVAAGVSKLRDLGAYMQGSADITPQTKGEAFAKGAGGGLGGIEEIAILRGATGLPFWAIMGGKAALKSQDKPLKEQAWDTTWGVAQGLAYEFGPKVAIKMLGKLPGSVGQTITKLAEQYPGTSQGTVASAGFGGMAYHAERARGASRGEALAAAAGTGAGMFALSASEAMRELERAEIPERIIASDKSPEWLREFAGKATKTKPVIVQTDAENPRYSSVYADPDNPGRQIVRPVEQDEAQTLKTRGRPTKVVTESEFNRVMGAAEPSPTGEVAPINRQIESPAPKVPTERSESPIPKPPQQPTAVEPAQPSLEAAQPVKAETTASTPEQANTVVPAADERRLMMDKHVEALRKDRAGIQVTPQNMIYESEIAGGGLSLDVRGPGVDFVSARTSRPEFGTPATIADIYVKPDVQRKGVGTAILRGILDSFQRHGDETFVTTQELGPGRALLAKAEREGWIERTGKTQNVPGVSPEATEYRILSTKPETDVPQTPVEAEPTALTAGATVDQRAHEAAHSPTNDLLEPTDAQKEAGNYKKGKVRIAGLDISIENPQGSVRSGVDKAGHDWSIELKSHYGYIRGYEGRDKDHLDVFVKPGIAPDYDGPVFVVNQRNEAGRFDEHKVMLGWGDKESAKQGYVENYDKRHKGIGSIASFANPRDFKHWLDNEDLKKVAQDGKGASDAETVRGDEGSIRGGRAGRESEVQSSADQGGENLQQPTPEQSIETKAGESNQEAGAVTLEKLRNAGAEVLNPDEVTKGAKPKIRVRAPEPVEPAQPKELGRITPKQIVRHSDPNIDGGEVVGRFPDGDLKVQNKEGGISRVQDPRREGNREAAVAKVEAPPPKRESVPPAMRRGIQVKAAPVEDVTEAIKPLPNKRILQTRQEYVSERVRNLAPGSDPIIAQRSAIHEHEYAVKRAVKTGKFAQLVADKELTSEKAVEILKSLGGTVPNYVKRELASLQGKAFEMVGRKMAGRVGVPKSDPTVNSLSEEVRARGGIHDDRDGTWSGEIARLKESGKRGLTQSVNPDLSKQEGMHAEAMAGELAQSGYFPPGVERDETTGFDVTNVGEFLNAVADDAAGSNKYYSTAYDPEIANHPDEEAFSKLEDDEYGKELLELVQSGRARAADIAELARVGREHGLSDEGLQAFLRAMDEQVKSEVSETPQDEGYSLDNEGTLLDPDGQPLFSRIAQHGLGFGDSEGLLAEGGPQPISEVRSDSAQQKQIAELNRKHAEFQREREQEIFGPETAKRLTTLAETKDRVGKIAQTILNDRRMASRPDSENYIQSLVDAMETVRGAQAAQLPLTDYLRQDSLFGEPVSSEVAELAHGIEAGNFRFMESGQSPSVTEGQALFASRSQTNEYLDALKTIDDDTELIRNLKSSREADIVWVNPEGQELLRRMESESASGFFGIQLDRDSAIPILRDLKAGSQALRAASLSSTSIDALHRQIVDAIHVGKGHALVVMEGESSETAIKHESFHQGSALGAAEKPLADRHTSENQERLHSMAAVAKWRRYFQRTPGLTNASKALAIEETAAEIAGDGGQRIGLTEQESAEFIYEWAKSFYETNGPKAFEAFRRQEDHVNKAIEAAKRFGYQVEAQKSLASGKVVRGRKGSARGQPESSVSEVRPQAAGLGRRIELHGQGEVKEASLPETLSVAGLDTEGLYYQGFTDAQGRSDAAELLERHGVEGSLRLLKDTPNPGKEHAVLSFMVQRFLLDQAATASSQGNEEEAARLRSEQQELAAAHASHATHSGQFNQAAALAGISVETALTVAQRIVQNEYGVNARVNPNIAGRIEEHARSAEQAFGETMALTVELGELRKRVAQLEKERGTRNPRNAVRVQLEAEEQGLINVVVKAFTLPPGALKMAIAKQIESPEFKKWFRDSKVVDEDGKPLVVYHGGVPGMTTFDAERAGKVNRSDWGKGIYFTPVSWMAKGYREDAALANNPDEDRLWKEYEAEAKRLGTSPMMQTIDLGFGSEKYNQLEEFKNRWQRNRDRVRAELASHAQGLYPVFLRIENPFIYQYEGMTDPFMADHAKAKGHDGILIVQDDGEIEEAVAFVSEQIKSATGNQGTFDPKNPNILKMAAPPALDKEAREALAKLGVLELIRNPDGSIEDWNTALREKIGEGVEPYLVEAYTDAFALRRTMLKEAREAAVINEFHKTHPDATEDELADYLETQKTSRERAKLVSGEKATKTRLLIRINELKALIETGEKSVKGASATNQDIELLKSERDRLQGVVDEMAGPKPPPEDKRIELATKAVRKSIADYDKRITEGHVAPEPKSNVAPWSEELGRLQTQRADLRNQLNEIRKQANAPTKERNAIAAQLKSVTKSIGALEARIQSGNVAPRTSGTAKPTSPEIEAAKAQRKILAKLLADMRKAARPRTVKTVAEKEAARHLPVTRIIGELAPSNIVAETAGKILFGNKAAYSDLLEAGIPKGPAIDIVRQAREIVSKAKEQAERERLIKVVEKDTGRKALDGEIDRVATERLLAKKRGSNARAELARDLDNLTKSPLWKAKDILVDLSNSSRSILAAGDLSAVLRQGGFLTLAYPEKQAEPIKLMLQAITELGELKAKELLENDPVFGLAIRSGIDFAELGRESGSLVKGEEVFRGDMAKKIPGIGAIVRASDRTYATFLDAQRLTTFRQFADELQAMGYTFRENPQAFRDVARLINIATGRGHLLGFGSHKLAAFIMNLPFFSPRNTISRFQLLNITLNPVAYARLSPGARKIVARSALRYYGMVAALLGLASLLGFKVVMDWNDPDFLKIRFGNTRFEIPGGVGLPARLLLRLVDIAIRGGRYPGERKEQTIKELKQFTRGKLAPGPALAWDWYTGENYQGQIFRWLSMPRADKSAAENVRRFMFEGAIAERVWMLPIQDIQQAWHEDGFGAALKTFPADELGVGTSTYKDNPLQPKTRAERLAAPLASRGFNSEPEPEEKGETRQKLTDIRARSMKNEDVKSELDKMVQSGEISNAQAKNVEGAKGLSKLEYWVRKLPPDQALLVVKEGSPAERRELLPLLYGKVQRAAPGSVDTKTQSDMSKLSPDLAKLFEQRRPVESELIKHDMKFPEADATVSIGNREIKLTGDKLLNYQKRVDALVYERLPKIIQSSEYQSADSSIQKKMLQEAQSLAHGLATAEIKTELAPSDRILAGQLRREQVRSQKLGTNTKVMRLRSERRQEVQERMHPQP